VTDEQSGPVLGDYESDGELMRRPLLTLDEAREIVDVLKRVAASGGPDVAEASRLAHLLAYRIPTT
jgi:hypothetical protein